MKEHNFHEAIKKYFFLLGEPLMSSSLSYDQKYILTHINEFIDNDFFTYQYAAIDYNNDTAKPTLFIMEIFEDKYIVIKNQGNKFINLTTNEIINKELLENKNLFFFRASERPLSEDGIYSSLIKLTPNSNLFSLPLILFALLLPLYSNLFNSRLVYSESVTSLIYISFIFLFVVGFEFFLKHLIHEKNLKKIKLNIGICNRYFINLLRKSNCKNAAIKIRTIETSISQIWEIRPQIIYDIGLTALFSLCIIGMLGFFSIFLLLYYTGLVFLCLHIRFKSYKNMLKANTLNYEKSAMLYSLEQKKKELNFINDSHFKYYIDAKTNEDEKIKLQLNEANHHWMEVIKMNSFISMIVMYVSCYLAIDSGALSLASIIAVLIINGRLSASITSTINRCFVAKTHLFHIKSSINQLTQNAIINYKEEGVLIGSINSVDAKNIAISFNGKTIINDLNIEAKADDIIGITGLSGSGKTSLINVLNGTSTNYTGEVTINDVKLNEISVRYFQEKVAYHSGISTFINGSIRDNFNLHGIFDNAIIIHIIKLCCPRLNISKETLDDMFISDVQASTGEKQKLMLAITLFKRPEILFLDESTSFMATHDAIVFIRLLINEFNLKNSIIFFSTHDMGLLPLFTQHIALSPTDTNIRLVSGAKKQRDEIIIPKITLN